jgi:hypothetical protein
VIRATPICLSQWNAAPACRLASTRAYDCSEGISSLLRQCKTRVFPTCCGSPRFHIRSRRSRREIQHPLPAQSLRHRDYRILLPMPQSGEFRSVFALPASEHGREEITLRREVRGRCQQERVHVQFQFRNREAAEMLRSRDCTCGKGIGEMRGVRGTGTNLSPRLNDWSRFFVQQK